MYWISLTSTLPVFVTYAVLFVPLILSVLALILVLNVSSMLAKYTVVAPPLDSSTTPVAPVFASTITSPSAKVTGSLSVKNLRSYFS